MFRNGFDFKVNDSILHYELVFVLLVFIFIVSCSFSHTVTNSLNEKEN
jgi:hypothetical protein